MPSKHAAAARARAGMAVRVLVTLALSAAVALALAATAGAAGASGWAISSVAEPTNFSSADSFSTPGHERCIEEGETTPPASGGVCDRYVLTVTNVSDKTLTGPIEIADSLPSGALEVANVEGRNLEEAGGAEEVDGGGFECEATTVECTYENPMPPGDVLQVTVRVIVTEGAAAQTVENHATVEKEGAVVASSGQPATAANTIDGSEPGFGIQDFAFQAYGADGSLDELAGAHPDSLTSTVDLNSRFKPEASASMPFEPVEEIKDIVVELPSGFVSDPLAASRCSASSVVGAGAATSGCPSTSRVGNIAVNFAGLRTSSISHETESALYDVIPDGGYPAQFGADVANEPISLYGQVVPGPDGYHLRVIDPGLPRVERLTLDGVSLTFFGDPGEQDTGGTPAAFLTNPTACTDQPLHATIYADSWAKPGEWVEGDKLLAGPNGPGSAPLLSSPGWVKLESVAYPGIEGCDELQFNPQLTVTPSTTQADEPAGYGVALSVAQAPNVAPDRATPDVKQAVVTLPAGVSLSPPAAEGLEGCSEAQLAPESDDAGTCPAKSQIGTVTITTPLLATPLRGRVFLRSPGCAGESCESAAEDGDMFGAFIEATGAGVTIKLKGTVEAGTGSASSLASGLQAGQLRAEFAQDPQLPFSELDLDFNGGAHAVLANPQRCGSAETSSRITPWSSETAATPFTSFAVDWNGAGEACPATTPFTPTFSAGLTDTEAGGFSPFTLTLSRADREQDLAGITLETPPGLLGMLARVPLCEEPQAAAGECPAASQIGSVRVAAGSGAQPLWLPQPGGREDPVYLTGPYDNAPFGLLAVVHAEAGPFDLGTVKVRATIDVNPRTAALSITTGPLPQILDGVPLRVRTIAVDVDRSGFTFAPTNCARQSVTARVSAAEGASAALSSPFEVGGCQNLPFKPTLTASTEAKTSKADGASLTVKLTYPHNSGAQASQQANVAGVKVELPKALPSRLATLQKACPEAVFAANPATCPPASVIGHAKAITPTLSQPLEGPVYFVSHGGAKFPEVFVVLQGEGVTVELVGETFVDGKTGVTSSTFKSLPDAPIESFEMTLPEGEFSEFTANGNLCTDDLAMPTRLTGQNGAVVEQATTIAVSGCPTTMSVSSHALAKQTLTLRVYVPAAGTLTASGRGLATVVKAAAARSELTIKLRQRSAGKLATTVKLSFAPRSGRRQQRELRASFRR